MVKNGRCAQTVGPRSKIFSSEKPPYWVVLTPLSNQNSADEIYIPVSKFSHSYTLNRMAWTRKTYFWVQNNKNHCSKYEMVPKTQRLEEDVEFKDFRSAFGKCAMNMQFDIL